MLRRAATCSLGEAGAWGSPSTRDLGPGQAEGVPGGTSLQGEGERQQAPRLPPQLLFAAFPTPQLCFTHPGSNLAG